MLLCIWVHTYFFFENQKWISSLLFTVRYFLCGVAVIVIGSLMNQYPAVLCWTLLTAVWSVADIAFGFLYLCLHQTLLLYLGDKPKSETFRADEQCYPIAKKDGRTVKLLVSFWVITDSSSVGLLSLGTGLMCYLKLPLQRNVIKERFL